MTRTKPWSSTGSASYRISSSAGTVARRVGWVVGARGGDFGLLFGGERHRVLLRLRASAALRRCPRRMRRRCRRQPAAVRYSAMRRRARDCAWPRRHPISSAVGQPTMAINGLRNKRCGPGGGTRRLHHFPPAISERIGRRLSWGRNRLDARGKGMIFARHGTAVIGSKLSCER